MNVLEQQPAERRTVGLAERLGQPKMLIALCLAFVLVRLVLIFTVPFQDAPDEFCHDWMIAFMCHHGRLPFAQEVAAGGVTSDYGSLPPLGYVPHVLLGWLAPAADLVLVGRFGSLLAGIALLLASYGLGREIFRDNKLFAFALPAIIVFHPQLAFVNAYANNDATASALCAVILLLALRAVRQGLKVAPCALIGVLVGWLVLSKYSALGIVPAVVLLLLAAAYLHKTPVRRTLAAAAICALCAIAVSSWWFVRNAHEYPGDMLGTKTIAQTYSAFHYTQAHDRIEVGQIRWWRFLFFSFWGLFGYMTKYMWRPVYLAYTGFLIASVMGLLRVVLACRWRRLVALDDGGMQDIAIWLAFALAAGLSVLAVVWTSDAGVSGPQGRYLFTSEIPILALLLLGLGSLTQRWGKHLVVAFVCFNAAVCLGVLVWFIGMYGFHWKPM